MNTQEHLEQIKQKCKKLIAIHPSRKNAIAGWNLTIAVIETAQ